jgi:hypothetical protein
MEGLWIVLGVVLWGTWTALKSFERTNDTAFPFAVLAKGYGLPIEPSLAPPVPVPCSESTSDLRAVG